MNLNELIVRSQNFMAAVVENGGEITTEMESTLDVGLGLSDKIDGYDFILGAFESTEAQLETRLTEIKQLQKNISTSRKRLKNYLIFSMRAHGVETLTGSLVTFTLCQTPGRIEITDMQLIPEEFKRSTVTVDVDKNLLKEHIKANGEVMGAFLVIEPMIRRKVSIK